MALDSASKMQETDANVQIVSELLLPLMKGFCVFSMRPHHKALGNIQGHNHAMFLPSSVNWKGLALGNLEICILVNIHLIYGPEGNSSFCFPESPDVIWGNIRTLAKTKLTSLLRDHTLSVLLYLFLDFPLNNHIAKRNKHGVRATTVQLYPDLDTFEFGQGHVTKNQPITVLILLSESLVI